MDKFASQVAEAMGTGKSKPGPRLLTPKEFLETTSDEVIRANRYDRPLTVALTVLDGFAQLRKTAGSEAAEGAFELGATAVLTALRGLDRVGRLGRGELGILMPETKLTNAETVCERLREAVAKHRVGETADTPPLGVSIGLAALSPRRRDPKAFLMMACFELRRAQSLGGGRVCTAEPEIVNVSIPRSAQIH